MLFQQIKDTRFYSFILGHNLAFNMNKSVPSSYTANATKIGKKEANGKEAKKSGFILFDTI